MEILASRMLSQMHSVDAMKDNLQLDRVLSTSSVELVIPGREVVHLQAKEYYKPIRG